MEVTLEPVDREAPEVRALYEVFIREADGPLVVGGAVVDLEAEFADGPPRDLVPPTRAAADGQGRRARPPVSAASDTSTPRSPR